jgi:hypothetical protein
MWIMIGAVEMVFSCYLAAIQCAIYHAILRPGWIWECTEGCMTKYLGVDRRSSIFSCLEIGVTLMNIVWIRITQKSQTESRTLCRWLVGHIHPCPSNDHFVCASDVSTRRITHRNMEHLFRLIRIIMRVDLRCTTMVCETSTFQFHLLLHTL